MILQIASLVAATTGIGSSILSALPTTHPILAISRTATSASFPSHVTPLDSDFSDPDGQVLELPSDFPPPSLIINCGELEMKMFCLYFYKTKHPLLARSARAAALLNAPPHGPEKNMKQINHAHFTNSMNTNCYSLITLYKSFLPLLHPPTQARYPVIVNLSARVGSISDDRSGGWWSYRISKTASNHAQLLAHIETNRQRHRANFLSIHPGTTYTSLSSPFVKGEGGTVHSPDYTAEKILGLVGGAGEKHSGGFYDWYGQSLPF